MTVPAYPKVLALGSRGTEKVLEGEVTVQEKIDGSQFRFGFDETGVLEFASHHKPVYPGSAGMFEPVIQHILDREEDLRSNLLCTYPIYFYGEYLSKPKHNTLAYERIPRGNLVLFDAYDGDIYHTIGSIAHIASVLECALVATYRTGKVTMEELEFFLTTKKPMLGGDMIEGVVIKNYDQNIMLGSQVFPVFCKYVSTTFKERHQKNPDNRSGKSKLEEFFGSFNTEARWNKAIQHLREANELTDSPKDIGPLVRAIAEDIVEEEGEYIKDALYALYIKDVIRAAQRGFPEYYKSLLADRVE